MGPKACLMAFVVLTLAGSAALAIPAFPGAEGFGAVTTGGRGGTVYEVTTLADSGPGSFRAACQASGTRTVVFRVAGTIHLDTELSIANPYITIAGQTAPGGGVCIAGETVSLDTHDIVVRHMRFRRGETNTDRRDDALGSDTSSGNIMVDHCSASWGLDENLSIYRYRKPDTTYGPTQNVTIQYCISSEALNTYAHAFGATWGGTMCSYHHNLFACNIGRNPSLSYPMVLDFRNNVLYNWDYRTIDGADGRAKVNIADNYYKSGPVTDSGELRYRIVKPDNRPPTDAYPGTGVWYVEGNYVVGYPGITADNWSGGVQYDGYLDPSLHRAYVPFAAPPLAEDDTAEEAYIRVLAEAGATRPGRDAVDVRVVGMVAAGTVTYTLGKGIITDPSQVGGWPTYATGTPPTDSDHDGMPNTWEIAHGLDPSVASNNGDYDDDGFTNLEEYLAELAWWPAPKPIIWTGGTGRYELITNWDIPWQPTLYDRAEINSGKATVGYQFQEAGTLYVGNTAASNGELAVTTGGQLLVYDRLILGNAAGAKGTASLTGGSLVGNKAIVLASAASSTGVLTVAKGAYVQVGGLTINTGSGRSSKVSLEIASDGCSLIHTTAASTLGGVMDVQSLSEYRPREGDKFTVISSTDPNGVHFTGNFTTFTSNITRGLPGSSAFGGAANGSNYEVVFVGYTSGDANGDHKVDGSDLALIGGAWMKTGQTWGTCDFTGDGVVDGSDLALMGGNWMWVKPSPGPGAETALPEPASLAFLGLAAAMVRPRRRR